MSSWQEKNPHSTKFSGGVCPHSSKAARGEDLQVEHPVWCRYSRACHFHAALAGMLSSTLIGDEVIEVRQSCQKRLLAPFGMMEALHGEQFPLHSVMGLIQQCTGSRHLRVFEDRIPASFLVLKPAPDARPVGPPSRGRDVA